MAKGAGTSKTGRFSAERRKGAGGRFVGGVLKTPPNYALLEDFDFSEHGLVCRRARNGRLYCNVEPRLLQYSEFSRADREWLWLDISLNVLDRLCPPGSKTPLKLKRGKAGREAVWLHIDFAREFFLNPRWKHETTIENKKLIEYQRFDLPLKYIENWLNEARLILLALKELK